MNAHEEFLKQYVLNRCIGNTGSMDGASVVNQAEAAWVKVQMLAGHASDSEKDYEGMREFQAKYIRASQELAVVKEELVALYTKHIAATKHNPSLENVLAKLRVILPEFYEKEDLDLIGCLKKNGERTVLTLGDLRRWIESEGK